MSTVDGVLTALDAKGHTLWSYCLQDPLFSSTLSYTEVGDCACTEFVGVLVEWYLCPTLRPGSLALNGARELSITSYYSLLLQASESVPQLIPGLDKALYHWDGSRLQVGYV